MLCAKHENKNSCASIRKCQQIFADFGGICLHTCGISGNYNGGELPYHVVWLTQREKVETVAATAYTRLCEGEEDWGWERRNPTLFEGNQLTTPGLYLSLGLL